jgi:hypothetical protein
MKADLFTRLLACLAAIGAADVATASILTTFNNSIPIADFKFNDAAGTAIEATANSATPGMNFDVNAPLAGVVTNGVGQLDATPKSNIDLGSTYINLPGMTTGRVLGLFELSWDFDELIYDAAQDEEMRISIVSNDPRSTFVTAETFFTRTSATAVSLRGNALGTGATATSTLVLGSSVPRMLTILDADLDADTYTLHYSTDGGASFLTLGPAALDPARGVESLRLVLNESFADDTVLIERVAFAVVPEPMTTALAAIGMVASALVSRRTSGR